MFLILCLSYVALIEIAMVVDAKDAKLAILRTTSTLQIALLFNCFLLTLLRWMLRLVIRVLPVYFERAVKNAGMLVGYIIVIYYARSSLSIILHPERGTPGFAPLIHGPIVAWFSIYWIRDQRDQLTGTPTLKETYNPSISGGLSGNAEESYASPHTHDRTRARVEVTEPAQLVQSRRVTISPKTTLVPEPSSCLTTRPPYIARKSPLNVKKTGFNFAQNFSRNRPVITPNHTASLHKGQVPSRYQENSSHFFKISPATDPLSCPTTPPPYKTASFSQDVERFTKLLSKIPLATDTSSCPTTRSPYTTGSSPLIASTKILAAPSPIPPISTTDLVIALGSKKHTFLSTIETRISTYVRSTGRGCVSIIERKPAPRVDELHKLGFDEWMPVFICFLLRKKYFSHTLDSALTEPIVKIVTDSYSEFITANSADINAFFLRQVTTEKVVEDAFMGYIAEQCVRAGVKQTRQRISHALTTALHHAIKSHVGQAIAHSTAHTAHVVATHTAVVTGSSAGHAVGTMLYKVLTKHIAVITSHALSHTFLSKVVAVLAKKYCVAAITVCVVQATLSHMGAGHAAMLFNGLAFLAVEIYIIYKITTLSRVMGQKLGAGVSAAMDDKFVPLTERALQDVVKAIQSPEGLANDVFREWSSTPGWKHDIENLAGGFPLGDTKHLTMENDVSRIFDKTSAIVEDVVKAKRRG